MLTDKSQSDYDQTKKAEWYDAEDYTVADENNKHKLKNPQKIADLNPKDKE